jgi:hypothetical protein
LPTPYRRQRPVQQTSAEFTEEMLTSSGHYKVEFTGSVCGPLWVITVRMPVLDPGPVRAGDREILG